MTPRPLAVVLLLALIGAALSAMGSLPPGLRPGEGARPAIRGEAGSPVRCGLSLSPLGAGTAIVARVTATRAVTGRYRLSIRSGDDAIDRGGAFEAAAGETVTLAEATLPGAPEALEATLAVTAGGLRVACPRELP